MAWGGERKGRMNSLYKRFSNKKGNDSISILLFFLVFFLFQGWGCSDGDDGEITGNSQDENAGVHLTRPDNPQIGVNFIRFFFEGAGDTPTSGLNRETEYFQPEWIFADFEDLGVQVFRQFVKADFFWDVVEPEDDMWNFAAADEVVTNPNIAPVVTLFKMQYASATPPWETDPERFQKTLGQEAKEYLEGLVERYGPYVRYWEIGNEMDHWRAADPDEAETHLTDPKFPGVYPKDGFTPYEQGVFFKEVSDFIRQRDDDAVIVMPGMGGINDYTLYTWLSGVIAGGGTEWFDVVNYHYYPSWESFRVAREKLEEALDYYSISHKPVWLTETGTSADPTLRIRTDYPNSEEAQAADVFRRLISAYGMGDSLVIWHSYIGGENVPFNNWRLYGLREQDSTPELSMYAFRLLATELIPFQKVETLSSEGMHIFRITTVNQDVKYVAWGEGVWPVPEGISQAASVVCEGEGNFLWFDLTREGSLELTDIPFLLR